MAKPSKTKVEGRPWYVPSLTTQILIGLVLGGLLGYLSPDWGNKIYFLRDIFLNLIKSIIAPLIFSIELISNLIRPFTLGIRLFANMFADEKVLDTIAHLAPGITYWVVPVVLMPLSLFVAFIQTFVFVLLSQLYISEVSHPPHDSHAHAKDEGMELVAPVLT